MRILRWVAALIALSGAAVVGINLHVLMSARGRTVTEPADLPHREIGVLPGCSEWTAPGVRNPHFVVRTNAASAVLTAGKVDRMILSGGAPEVAELRGTLEWLGHAPDALIDDDLGLNTEASIRNAQHHGPFTVVGEAYHMPRALLLARRHGADAVAYVVRYETSHLKVLRGCVKYRRIPAREREWIARVKDFLLA